MSWLPKRTVVTPVDFSEDSLVAVDTSLQMVDDPSHVHVVHVLQELSPVEPGEIWHTVSHESRKKHAAQALRERLSGEKYAQAPIEILFGDPGHEITNYAESIEADLIVMPSHGRTGFSRLLIGSVAERVIRLAHCPVLVLRAPSVDGFRGRRQRSLQRGISTELRHERPRPARGWPLGPRSLRLGLATPRLCRGRGLALSSGELAVACAMAAATRSRPRSARRRLKTATNSA